MSKLKMTQISEFTPTCFIPAKYEILMDADSESYAIGDGERTLDKLPRYPCGSNTSVYMPVNIDDTIYFYVNSSVVSDKVKLIYCDGDGFRLRTRLYDLEFELTDFNDLFWIEQCYAEYSRDPRATSLK